MKTAWLRRNIKYSENITLIWYFIYSNVQIVACKYFVKSSPDNMTGNRRVIQDKDEQLVAQTLFALFSPW